MPLKATLTGVQVAIMLTQVVLSVVTVVYLMTYVSNMRRVNEQQECQIAVNTQLRERSALIAAAQTTYNKIDERFTEADEVWVADQMQVLEMSTNRTLSQAERERLTDRWQRSLAEKLKSATEKKDALRALDKAREANPVPPPPTC
jgi:hypothetical protein